MRGAAKDSAGSGALAVYRFFYDAPLLTFASFTRPPNLGQPPLVPKRLCFDYVYPRCLPGPFVSVSLSRHPCPHTILPSTFVPIIGAAPVRLD